MADGRAKGNAKDVGHGHACDHDGNGLRAFVLVGQFVGHDGTDPEESAVRQTGYETGDKHDPIVRGECCTEVSDQDQGTESEQNAFQGLGAGDQRQQGSADTDAQRVGSDKVTGLRDRDAEMGRHVGQNAHHDEFGNAQCKSTGSQCGQAFFHAGGVWCSVKTQSDLFFSYSLCPDNSKGAYCTAIWSLSAVRVF